MSNKLSRFKVNLEVKGPIFVGSGEEIYKSEYIYDKTEGIIYVMDIHKMYNGLKRLNKLNDYEESVIKYGSNFTLFNYISNSKISKSEYQGWSAYSYNVKFNEKERHILSITKDSYNNIYIPGSSLKGAIRNAYMNYKMLNNKELLKIKANYNNIVFGHEEKKRSLITKESKALENVIFNNNSYSSKKEDALNDIFRGIRISDSKPLNVNCLTLCQKIDYFIDGKNKKLPIYRECIKPGTVIEFDMIIDRDYFKLNGADGLEIETIKKAINYFYNEIEVNFLSKFPDNNIYNNKSEGLIFVGGGVGLLSKTAIYSLFENKDDAVKITSKVLNIVFGKNSKNKDDYMTFKISPHTRKCTEYDGKIYDFGLCKISFEPML